MNKQLQSPYGSVQISLRDSLMLKVSAESDLGAFYGQGFATCCLRLWQLDLSRRVAGGSLSAILGPRSRRSDIFQRKLGLAGLARRETERIEKLTTKNNLTCEENKDLRQADLCQAYVHGLNDALKQMRIPPVECLLLGYRPEPFCLEDVYLAAMLKYFINSAWQFELFHTRLSGRFNDFQSAQLFASFSQEGELLPPLPRDGQGRLSPQVADILQDGLYGLELLGLSSPDTGSNVFAVSGQRTSSGKPLLAADPHMGQVNPGFNLLCTLKSDEGLLVSGSHFPGIPGIVVGRNRHAAWGMVGIMADNQDLFWAKIDLKNDQIRLAEGWEPLCREKQRIQIKGKKDLEIFTFSFAAGKLIQAANGYGLFLRWPALDKSIGDFTLYDLAHCTDWSSFRHAISRMYNAPMMVGYADVHGDIGLQTAGLFPKRRHEAGSLVQTLSNPECHWTGYADFDELPNLHNPPEGYIVYANQYSSRIFGQGPHISNRWHPPTRAMRIVEKIKSVDRHDLQTIADIQDDKIDCFARNNLPYLLSFLDCASGLGTWNADTRRTDKTLLFDRWLALLCRECTTGLLGPKTLELYRDFWPAWRWCTLVMLKNMAKEDPEKLVRIINSTHAEACSQKVAAPRTELQHSLKTPLLRSLFTIYAPYSGGNRETVYATRQNADFLTASQSQIGHRKDKPFTFGPAFRLISCLKLDGEMSYFANSPAQGSPFFWNGGQIFKQWLQGQRRFMKISERN